MINSIYHLSLNRYIRLRFHIMPLDGKMLTLDACLCIDHLFIIYVCLPLVVCGGTLNATTSIQTMTSPFYPNAYPPHTSCRWILDAPPQETIQVSVKNFVLHPSQSCSTNYLEMKDWPMVSSDCEQPRKVLTASIGNKP